jgi:hypothetical protein
MNKILLQLLKAAGPRFAIQFLAMYGLSSIKNPNSTEAIAIKQSLEDLFDQCKAKWPDFGQHSILEDKL